MKALLAFLFCLSSVVFTQAQPLPAISPGGPAALPGRATTPPPGADSEYAVVARGPNHRVWAKVTWTTNASGQIMARTDSFTELSTGLLFKRNGQGDWLETSEKIAILPGGQMAAATNGPHQVYFPADLYTGAIEVVTPDGKHLLSRPSGLSYFDGTNDVLIAELTNSIGQVLPSGNQVIWTNCFTGIQADIIATYRKSGFECDLVFRSAPPPPEAYGLGACWVQLWTEFFDPPQPTQRLGKPISPEGAADVTLDFGTLKMVQGRAFSVGDRSTTASGQGGSAKAGPRHRRQEQTPVYKRWGQLDGRTFLIEEVPYQRVKSQLEELALNNIESGLMHGQPLLAGHSPHQRNGMAQSRGVVAAIVLGKPFGSGPFSSPLQAPFRPVQRSTNVMQVARAGIQANPGFVLDWVGVSGSVGDYTFQSDQTYFVSGVFYVDATVTIEGGTVIKFPQQGYRTIYCNQVVCHTGPYRMAALTSENDNSVGQTLPWSSGTPGQSGSVYLCPDSPPRIMYLRIAYAYYGVLCASSSSGDPMEVSDCQLMNCLVQLRGFWRGPEGHIGSHIV